MPPSGVGLWIIGAGVGDEGRDEVELGEEDCPLEVGVGGKGRK